MKSVLLLAGFLVVAVAQPCSAQTSIELRQPSAPAPTLPELARGHEEVFKGISPGPASMVLQKGDKQFTIYGVIAIRAVGSVVEITVKNGEKYSVGAQDIFFITNNAFKI